MRRVKIGEQVDGIEKLVEREVDESQTLRWKPRSEMRLLGKHMQRVDGPEKVSGTAVYTQDVRLPKMLFARILISPHAHARIRSIDLAPALRMPGVRAAISATEIYRVLMSSAKQMRIADITELRYEGQPVAAVAAETPSQAEDGIRAIKVDYEVLPHAVCWEDAVAPHAPLVYGEGNTAEREKQGDREQVARAFVGAASVIEAEYQTATLHHVSLEPHAVVADLREHSATVWLSTQATSFALGDFAAALGLPESEVTIEVQHMGGGFGAKFGGSLEGRFACQLSKQTGRPVKLALDRRAEFLMVGNRSASRQTLKAAVDREGRITAFSAEQVQLGGLGFGTQHLQPYIYQAQSSASRLVSVHTHTNSSRAMRAPGSPQASFAMESMIDELAHKLKKDPLQVRKQNLTDPVYHRQLDRGAREIGWERRGRTRGRGLGCALSEWGGWGGPGCVVTLSIARDGSVEVKCGTQDLGTGTRTLMRAIVAEELGLGLGDVRERIGNSRFGAAVGSGGSANTASLAPAVQDASVKARAAFAEKIAAVLRVPSSAVALSGGAVQAGNKRLSWKEACALLPLGGVTAGGEWKPGLNDGGVHGACFAEVEVDLEFGTVRPIKIVHVQDLGFPLNRTAVESQIIGGVIQGMGMALFEERVIDRRLGKVLSASFNDYRLPGALEMPEIVPIIDDEDTREGVIGVGEPPVIAVAGAISNAVFDACGVRVRDLPITPDKILRGLFPEAV